MSKEDFDKMLENDRKNNEYLERIKKEVDENINDLLKKIKEWLREYIDANNFTIEDTRIALQYKKKNFYVNGLLIRIGGRPIYIAPQGLFIGKPPYCINIKGIKAIEMCFKENGWQFYTKKLVPGKVVTRETFLDALMYTLGKKRIEDLLPQ